jgi:M6 family metalloprotease-like protein
LFFAQYTCKLILGEIEMGFLQHKTWAQWNKRLFRTTILIILVFSGISPASLTPQNRILAPISSPQFAPPNPRLDDKIKSGEIKLPRHMTDQAWAASTGIEGFTRVSQLQQSASLTGTIKMLAVAVDFSDKVHTVTAEYFDSLLFALPVSGIGSMRDYYNEVSYGQIDFVTVNLPSALGWRRAPQNYAYYVNGNYGDGYYPYNDQKFAEDIFAAINSVVDFSQYDNNHDGIAEPISIIHAGRGAEFTGNPNDMWSLSWSTLYAYKYDGVWVYKFTIQPEYMLSVNSTTSDMTIGVYAHEAAHGFFSVPDTYDTDYTSRGAGNFDLMAGGSWNGTLGDTPAWPSAWIRKQMGILTPLSVTTNSIAHGLPQVYENPSLDTVFKLSSPLLGSQEYFLVENRQKTTGSYDQSLPGSGLLIWHIDEAKTNNDNECYSIPQSNCGSTHYRVSLVQADGQYDLEKDTNNGTSADTYPGTTLNRNFSSASTPESSSYYTAGESCIAVKNISDSGAGMTADLIVNCPPAAAADSYSTDEDTSLTVATPGVLSNDSDRAGDTLTSVKVSDPSHGTLTLNTNGSFIYTPAANWNGDDSFTYKASDGSEYSAVVTVNLSVASINDAPAAVNDSYNTNEDTALNVAAQGVLANDTDVENNALSAVLKTGPAHGSLTLNSDGSFGYIPNSNWNGLDSFTYWGNDGTLASASPATVQITIDAVDDAPNAAPDNYPTSQNATLTITAPGLLNNDSDIDSATLTAIKVSDPAHGTLLLNSDGSFTYIPETFWYGEDSFTYKANDGVQDSNIATVTIAVDTNFSPVAADNDYTLDEDGTFSTSAPGLLGNDTDADDNTLTAVKVSDPAHGALTLNSDGSFSYTSTANWYGTDSFTYQATDGIANSNVATVTLNVSPVNDAPTAAADSYATGEDTVLDIPAPGLLANDNDIDSTLTVTQVSAPTHGNLTLHADGSLSYTPDPDWNGTDSFTYQAFDGVLYSNTVSVTLTVNAINDAPAASADSYTTDQDSALTISAPGLLGNDTDVDNITLSAVKVSSPTHGSLVLNADGSFVYTPASGYYGADSFTYSAYDGTVNSAVTTVSIEVKHVNHAPTAKADQYTASRNRPLHITIGLLVNDSDPDSDVLTAIILSDPQNGVLVLNPDGSFTYTPQAGFTGTDSFTYKASDGALSSEAVTVTITVQTNLYLPVILN